MASKTTKNDLGISTRKLNSLIKRNALFVINHSGGKDSQAMYAILADLIPHDQILVVHAELPGAEWSGVIDHVKATIHDDVAFTRCEAITRDGEQKTFESMVLGRGFWPSPSHRQCTSDLKRGPIEKVIRHHLKANPQHNGLIVSAMGLRAQESSKRSKATVWSLSKRNSKAGREWYEWLPIHKMLIEEVFETIKGAGQKPHWAYDKGMSRLSCVFCIMGSKADTVRAAKLNPEMYAKYVALEKAIDQTFVMPKKGVRIFLPEFTGVKVDQKLVEKELARLEVLAEGEFAKAA